MKSNCIFVLVLALSALAAEPLSASELQGTSPSVPQLVRQSSFIFAGTVQKLNATTMSTYPASESTAVVRVDEVLRNAGVVTDILGKNVTVQLARPGTLKEGEQAVFFTNVAVYGSSLAVREVTHLNPESTAAKSQVGEALRQLPDEDLTARIAQADLVIVGRVSSVRPVEARTRRPRTEHPPTSEHDPDWWQSAVQVESVEKGQSNARVIIVYFPHSDDIRWFASPKFREGQEGIFILRQTRDEELRVNGLTALHPLDFQSKEQQPRIRALIQKGR